MKTKFHMDQNVKKIIVENLVKEWILSVRLAGELSKTMEVNNLSYETDPCEIILPLLGVTEKTLTGDLIVIIYDYQTNIQRLSCYEFIDVGLTEITRNFLFEVEESIANTKSRRGLSS